MRLDRPRSSPATQRPPRLSARAAFLAVVGLLLGLIALRRVMPGGVNVVVGAGVGLGTVALARAAGLSWRELGLARADLGRGARYGGAVMAIIAGGLVLAALLPFTRGFLDDERADITFGALAIEVLVSTPIGTVVLEELAFRSALLGLAARETTTWRAALASSVLFGLWHIPPTLGTAGGNEATAGLAGSVIGLSVTVVAMVLAMTVAGLGFCWLRLRSGSTLAPAMAHVATNSFAFMAAWGVGRYG